jgi:uncharacterized protein (TIGR03437 family)
MKTCILASFLVAGVAALHAQTFSTLVTFGLDNESPNLVIQGRDGNFYVANSQRNILQVTPAGTFTVFYGASSTSYFVNELLQLSNGSFIGTTTSSGGGGGFFTLSPAAAFADLYTFPEHAQASGPIVAGTDGNYYGATQNLGGTLCLSEGNQSNGCGTIYQVTPLGRFTSIYSFGGPDGYVPSGVIAGSDGNLYGTTQYGGEAGAGATCQILILHEGGCGTVFQISLSGALTTLYKFSGGADGGNPTGGVIQGKDGNFYGATVSGGQNGVGTLFKLTPGGTLTTLHSFSTTDGGIPDCLNAVYCSVAVTVQGSDGNMYGSTQGGGTGPCTMFNLNGCGTIFEIAPSGEFSSLYSFGAINGSPPGISSLIQGSDGNLYGTTESGGEQISMGVIAFNGFGTLFEFTLVPPVSQDIPVVSATGGVSNGASFQPGISAGSWITINGTNLSSTTDTWANAIVDGALPTTLDGVSVMVGDQPANIEYVSATQINALAPGVPAGTVPVTVTTAIGTSAAVNAQLTAEQPAFFQWGTYAVATRQNFSIAVKNGTFAGITTVPAAPGDVIILWGTGFGPTSPSAPAGEETPSTTTYNTATTVSVTVGNKPATVYGAALAPGYAGLYQVAIQIPASLANGDYPVVATINGVSSPSTTMITVQQ